MKWHTPAPWNVDSNDDCLITADSDGLEVVTVDCGDRSEEENTANRKLISAAPELLHALERIISWIDCGSDPSPRSIEKAREVIRKARA